MANERINIPALRRIFGLQEGQTAGMLPTQSGRVAIIDGADTFWTVNDDGCVEVGVKLDSGQEIWCEGCPGGGAARGMYQVPSENDEVIVALPGGDPADAYLLAWFPTGGAPGDLQPGRTLLINDEVYAYSSDGASVEKLIKKSEYDALREELETFRAIFNAHMHGGVTTGGGLTGVPGTTHPTPYPAADGTSVLKAE